MDHSNLSIKKGGKNIPANWQVYIIINDAPLICQTSNINEAKSGPLNSIVFICEDNG